MHHTLLPSSLSCFIL
ncbi:unnamed protein product [Discula destructiva]